VTVAESCFDTGGVGAEVSIPGVQITDDAQLNVAAALFGESASRAVVSVAPADLTTVIERAAAAHVPAAVIGQTGGRALRIAVAGRIAVEMGVDEAERTWNSPLEQHFAKRVA
jgi:phosphoribosylformylglycinamidine synthase